MNNATITAFLKRNQTIITILCVVFVLELGERTVERFLPIYILAISSSAKQAMMIIGLLNALDNLLGALYSFPGGYLSDRIGYKKSLIIFDIISMLGYLIIILFPSWQGAIIGAILFTSWSSVSLPAIMTVLSKNLPKHKLTMGVSMHSLVRRFPMALGPLIGGFCIAKWGDLDGIRVAFLVSFGVAFVSIFIQNKFIKSDHQKTQNIGLPANPLKILAGMSSPLKNLLISDILIRFCEQIPYAFVVIWCMKNVGASAVQFGVLSSIEMLTAVLVYIPVAYLVEKKQKKKPFIAITFGFFILFPLVLLFSKSMWALSIAFLVRGLKEFGEPTRKSLILDFAQGPQQGSVYGAYYMVRDTIVAMAAFLGGLLWLISPQINFLAAFMFGMIGLFYFLRYCEE